MLSSVFRFAQKRFPEADEGVEEEHPCREGKRQQKGKSAGNPCGKSAGNPCVFLTDKPTIPQEQRRQKENGETDAQQQAAGARVT